MAVKAPESNKVFHCQWRERSNEYLVTNDFGYFIRLKPAEFDRWTRGKMAKTDKCRSRLAERGFVRDCLNFEDLASKWKKRNTHMFLGPGLHILVMTLRCNHTCLYCQSGAVSAGSKKTDMPLEVAVKSVDTAFDSPRQSITIEFQGGEPLLNWEVLKQTVKYAREKEKRAGKELKLALVSNFALMDKAKADDLMSNEVSMCTSLDGPRRLHNRNRRWRAGASSYDVTVKWIKEFQKQHDSQSGRPRIFKPSALLTVSKYSMAYPSQIVDEYCRLGLDTIFIRPLSMIGYAAKLWDKIGYTPKEFVGFYRDALNYIVELNRKGRNIKEKTCQMILEKLFNFEDPGYLDLMCPCGASIGQLAYNYDGAIYTCDEARMLGWEGDGLFKVGNVSEDSYRHIMLNAATKACVVSSNLEQQPMCHRCAYKPYCGVCPVHNYASQKSIWGNMTANSRCEIFMGIFDAVFDILKKPSNEALLRKWTAKG
ncbi:MAG: His-Xaa-Ser system radical SAM maturase HxsB [Elusimicrobia bacterium]|nr:His-Xaa-Ser system radical SAM maturase HxsB [Elusimicrobiota bacterium]